MSELEIQETESQLDDDPNKRMAAENERKREKIRSNYETIEALKSRLDEHKRIEKAGMTRAAYLKMIFDATKKVDKQNQELSRAIMDTRQMQKDINNLNGRLDRSFALVKDMIAKNIRQDDWRKECYKLLNTVHQNCDQLIRAVQERGEVEREIKQLEDQLSRLCSPSRPASSRVQPGKL